ncbi:MAG: YhgE/Pip domain-containing protein [Caryophanon sp.]|nr:YhgE/Pip domain-containing protein [Caryophanon sp.]
MLKSEWKHLCRTPKGIAAIIAIMMLPIVYTGLFLWAFWDPYSNLDALPVAIVNDDVSYDFEGETLQLGDDLVEKLIDSNTFQFDEVLADEAQAGLDAGNYYLIIEIPKTFSQHATTLLDEEPQKLMINYVANEGQNFLGGQIGETAVTKIREEVNEQVARTYAEMLFESIVQAGDGMVEATNGAVELQTGALNLASGTTDLKEYLKKLASSTVSLVAGITDIQDGVKQAQDGAATLADGLHELADGNVQLQSGITDVAAGASTLRTGLTDYTSGVSQVATGYETLQQKQQQFEAGMETFATSTAALAEGATKLHTSTEQLTAGTATIATGAAEAAAGVAQVAQGANNVADEMVIVSDKSAALQQGTATIAANAQQLQQAIHAVNEQLQQGNTQQAVTMMNELTTASDVLAAGASQLQQGASELTVGTQQIATGAADVSNGLTRANDAVTQVASGAASLQASTEQLHEGTSTLSAGVNEVVTASTTIHGHTTQLTAGYAEAFTGLKRLTAENTALISGAEQLQQGLTTIGQKMTDFGLGLASAEKGSIDLSTGVDTLAAGTVDLVTGTKELSTSSNELAEGSVSLATGALDLANGTTTLSTELTSAQQEVSTIHPTEGTYDMMASPVHLSKTVVNEVPNYGTGFAPYFISLGLAVGGLLIAQIYDYVSAYRRPTSGTAWFMSKMSVLVLISLAQATFVTIVVMAIGVDVTHPLMMFGVSFLASMAFISIVQMLVTWLGDVGKFLALIVLIVQLVTSAGTFPIELIPSALQQFYGMLPMTYSVEAFRAIISTGDMNVLRNSSIIITLFTLPSIAMTYTYFLVKYRHVKRAEQITA